jgi:hypothetical protein
LLTGVAGYQVAVAAGAPLGEHVWGGRFDAVLPPKMRAASGASAIVLLAVAVVALVAAGTVRLPFLERRVARRVTAVLAAYFALNTAGNLASESKVEKVMMGAVTAMLTVLLVRIARTTP